MDSNFKAHGKPGGRTESVRLSIRLYPSIEDDMKIIDHLRGLSRRQNGGISSVIKSILLSHFTKHNKIADPSLPNKKNLGQSTHDIHISENGNGISDRLRPDAMARLTMEF